MNGIKIMKNYRKYWYQFWLPIEPIPTFGKTVSQYSKEKEGVPVDYNLECSSCKFQCKREECKFTHNNIGGKLHPICPICDKGYYMNYKDKRACPHIYTKYVEYSRDTFCHECGLSL